MAIFMGNSRYSSDFQAVIDRAVAIASLPLTQMQQDAAALSDQSKALASIDTRIAAVQSAVTAIETALTTRLTNAMSSDTSVLTANASENAIEGQFTLNISDVGAFSTAVTGAGLPPVVDPATATIRDLESSLSKLMPIPPMPATRRSR
jgi:flagellar hook-associated protein 2